MPAFPLEVVTPEQALFSGVAQALVLRSTAGDMTVLDGHTSLVAGVEPGDVRIDMEDGSTVHLAVHGGFLQVDTSPGAAEGAPGPGSPAGAGPAGESPVRGLSTRVTLLAGIAELADRIDVARARRAKEESDARLAELGGPAALERPAASEGGATDERALEAAEVAAASARAALRLQVAGEGG